MTTHISDGKTHIPVLQHLSAKRFWTFYRGKKFSPQKVKIEQILYKTWNNPRGQCHSEGSAPKTYQIKSTKRTQVLQLTNGLRYEQIQTKFNPTVFNIYIFIYTHHPAVTGDFHPESKHVHCQVPLKQVFFNSSFNRCLGLKKHEI